MHSRANGLVVTGLLGLAVACGGTVIEQDGDTDGGTGGSTAGSGGSTGGSGGSVGGSGGSVGGSGGSVGGSGGYVGGSGGSTGGMGGSVGGSGGIGGSGGNPTCPPLPSCNWCGGDYVYDANGCPVGYVCANGVDPCYTDPCSDSFECAPGETCIDMLCWPGGPVSCSESKCDGYVDPNGAGVCDCGWTCNDGNDYRTSCETDPGGGVSCECYVNGLSDSACGASGGSGGAGGGPMPDPCSVDCCGFPK